MSLSDINLVQHKGRSTGHPVWIKLQLRVCLYSLLTITPHVATKLCWVKFQPESDFLADFKKLKNNSALHITAFFFLYGDKFFWTGYREITPNASQIHSFPWHWVWCILNDRLCQFFTSHCIFGFRPYDFILFHLISVPSVARFLHISISSGCVYFGGISFQATQIITIVWCSHLKIERLCTFNSVPAIKSMQLLQNVKTDS